MRYLCEVGLGYLTLDRSTRTLSGGEVQRVNLTTCLGASLVNTLFVMDEPSVGLHPRDVGRLVKVMHDLRDKGNTLLVVEHEEAIIRAADHLLDIGPGRGESGGELVSMVRSQIFWGAWATRAGCLRRLANINARRRPQSSSIGEAPNAGARDACAYPNRHPHPGLSHRKKINSASGQTAQIFRRDQDQRRDSSTI